MTNRLRLLIADNSEDFVWLLVQLFSKYPEIEIVGIAHDGRQAIEMVRQTRPDILLLDIVMPEVDGIEALRLIRCENEQIKVFVMSAVGISAMVETARALGIEQYYVKPFDFYHMVRAIRG